MRSRFMRIAAAISAIIISAFAFAIQASARDIQYDFPEIEMSVKIPDTLLVITPTTPRGDTVFTKLDLDYDSTMTAFHNANIYLSAYEPNNAFQISLTVRHDENSATVNNYSDLNPAQLNEVLEALSADSYDSPPVQVKRGGYVFFDTKHSVPSRDKTVYITQTGTVVNGMQIDFSMQKTDEPSTPEEDKLLSNIAGSISFNTIRRDSGSAFDWWRLLLWVFILIIFNVAISLIYRHRNEAKKRLMEERRLRRAGHNEPADGEESPMTFEQSLGYRDDEEFVSRADADEMAAYDISVQEKDPNKGISYFEDEGSGIDDGSDYFDTYFEEPTEHRTIWQRMGEAISSWFSRISKHIGYFFKNLKNKLFSHKNKK